jgi:hypothetical protein
MNPLKTLVDFSPVLLTKFTSYPFTFFISLRFTLFQHTFRRWVSVNCLEIFKTGKILIPSKQRLVLLQHTPPTISILYLPSSGFKRLLLYLHCSHPVVYYGWLCLAVNIIINKINQSGCWHWFYLNRPHCNQEQITHKRPHTGNTKHTLRKKKKTATYPRRQVRTNSTLIALSWMTSVTANPRQTPTFRFSAGQKYENNSKFYIQRQENFKQF